MKTFKRIFISAVVFVLVISIGSTVILSALLNSEWEHCFDLKNRDDLAGTIEVLICGASQGMNHYNTYTIDEKLGICYNTSGPAMTWDAKAVVLEEELAKNNVKYVLIDISHNSLMQEPTVSGEYYALPRISKGNRAEYFFKKIDPSLWYELYGKMMNEGVKYFASRILGEISILGTTTVDNCFYPDKGFRFNDSIDITLTNDEIRNNYKIKNVNLNFPEKNIENLKSMVESCKRYGAKPIIVQSFASNRLNWEYAGLQNLHDYLLEFCKENDCVFIDGNLLIDRYDIFSDTNSFIDDQHLSGEGATVFSKKICEIIKKIDLNEDVTGAFYSSYSEMQKASPYMSYYLSTIE